MLPNNLLNLLINLGLFVTQRTSNNIPYGLLLDLLAQLGTYAVQTDIMVT